MKRNHICINEFEATRLTFRTKKFDPRRPGGKDTRYVYDMRGYEFATLPLTGERLKEPKESSLENVFNSILFDAYFNRDGSTYFAFFTPDYFDPPLYLIEASNEQDAYDIYLDEFAGVPDDETIERKIDDLLIEVIEECLKEGSITLFDQTQITIKEWLAHLKEERPSEYEAFRDTAEGRLTDDGEFSFAPNGARTVGGSPWRYSSEIEFFELELIKAEVFE